MASKFTDLFDEFLNLAIIVPTAHIKTKDGEEAEVSHVTEGYILDPTTIRSIRCKINANFGSIEGIEVNLVNSGLIKIDDYVDASSVISQYQRYLQNREDKKSK